MKKRSIILRSRLSSSACCVLYGNSSSRALTSGTLTLIPELPGRDVLSVIVAPPPLFNCGVMTCLAHVVHMGNLM